MQLKNMRWVKCSIIVAFLALSSTINICSAVNWSKILGKSAKSVNHVSSQVSSQDGLQDGSQGDYWIWGFFVVAIVFLLGAYIRKYKKKEKWDKSGVADAVMGAVLRASVCYVIVIVLIACYFIMKGDENAEAKNSLRMEYIKPNKYDKYEEYFRNVKINVDSLLRAREIDSLVRAREIDSLVRAREIDSLVRARE